LAQPLLRPKLARIMQIQRLSTAILVPATLFALSACAEEGGGSDGDTSSAQSESDGGGDNAQEASIPMAETAWLSVGNDGAVQTTMIDPAGRYRDFRNGEPAGQGSWSQRPDGSICFEPAQGSGACWETGAPQEDGSLIATNDDGMRVEITRIAYTAPSADADAEAGETS